MKEPNLIYESAKWDSSPWGGTVHKFYSPLNPKPRIVSGTK